MDDKADIPSITNESGEVAKDESAPTASPGSNDKGTTEKPAAGDATVDSPSSDEKNVDSASSGEKKVDSKWNAQEELPIDVSNFTKKDAPKAKKRSALIPEEIDIDVYKAMVERSQHKANLIEYATSNEERHDIIEEFVEEAQQRALENPNFPENDHAMHVAAALIAGVRLTSIFNKLEWPYDEMEVVEDVLKDVKESVKLELSNLTDHYTAWGQVDKDLLPDDEQTSAEEQALSRATGAGILRNNMGPLIPVKPHKHLDSKEYHGTDMRPCQILIGKETFPRHLGYKSGETAWNLAEFEFGLHVNPCLELLLYRGERGSKTYDFKRVQWNPVGGQMTDITEKFVGVEVNEDGTLRAKPTQFGSTKTQGAHVLYSFLTEGCAFAANLEREVAGVHQTDDYLGVVNSFRSFTKEGIAKMQPARKAVRVTLKIGIDVDSPDTELSQRMHRYFRSFSESDHDLWHPYLSKYGNPMVSFNGFNKRKDINDAWGREPQSFDELEADDDWTKQGDNGKPKKENPYIGSNIIQVADELAFTDAKTMRIILAYGAALDDAWVQTQSKAFNALPQTTCAFMPKRSKNGPPQVHGFIRLGQQQTTDVLEENMVHKLSDNTTVLLSIKDDLPDAKREVKLRGRILPPGMTNTPIGNFTMVLTQKSAKLADKLDLHRERGQAMKWWNVKPEINASQAQLKRYLEALQQLEERPTAARFLPALLNQDPAKLETAEVGEYNGYNQIERRRKYYKIMKAERWGKAQRQVMTSCCWELRGNIGLIQGFPGCDETRVASAMLLYFMSIGMPVIAGGTTNPATDDLAERIDLLLRTAQSGNPEELDPELQGKKVIRVYASSYRGLLDQYNDGKFREQYLIQGKSVNELVDEELKVSEDISDEEDREFMMVNKALKQGYKDIISKPHLSLQVRLVEHAHQMVKQEVKLLKAVRAPANPSDFDEEGSEDDDNEYLKDDIIDVYAEFIRMYAQLQELDFSEWDKEDKRYFRKLKAHVEAATIANADCVICTASIMGSDTVRTNIGRKLKGTKKEFMCLFEEAGLQNAIEGVMFTRFAMLNNLRGVIYCGDPRQFRGINPSSFARIGVNEFINYLRISVFERLILNSFPSTRLVTNYRSAPYLISFPSGRNYDGMMRTPDGAAERLKPPIKTTLVIKAFAKPYERFPNRAEKDRPNLDHYAYCLFAIKDSQQSINEYTRSRTNQAHARVVTELIFRLLTSSIGDAMLSKSAIITSYKEQAGYYQRLLIELGHRTGKWEELPDVITGYSTQNEEYDMVILDNVISRGSTTQELGIVGDERHANVTHTGARMILIEVGGRRSYTAPAEINEVETTRITNVDGRFLRHPSPYIKEHFAFMRTQNRVYTINNALEDCGVAGLSYETALKTDEAQIKPYPVAAKAATKFVEAQVDTTHGTSTPVSAANIPAPVDDNTISMAIDPPASNPCAFDT